MDNPSFKRIKRVKVGDGYSTKYQKVTNYLVGDGIDDHTEEIMVLLVFDARSESGSPEKHHFALSYEMAASLATTLSLGQSGRFLRGDFDDQNE